MTCPKTATANGFAYEFVTLVKDSHLHAQYGGEGKPGSLTLDGDIAADGSVLINASGYSGLPSSNQNNIPAGVPYGFQVPLKLDGTQGAASIHMPLGRPCDFTFARR